FKVFQKEVENQLGKTIKSLRSDRGGEYMSQEFLDHLKDHGIIAHRTPPYTPQHNGVSERRNKTLLDMVRSMMSQTTLPNIPMLQSVKTYLRKCFAVKDLGEAAYILGIKIYRDRSKRLIGLCQSAYIEKILKRYCMENSKRGSIPMQEKLKLSKSQGASIPAEMKRMQNVPYASAFTEVIKNESSTDAGYLTDADDLKSQTGYVFVLNGGVVDWKRAKQSIFATSSAEAEYIAAFDASNEAVWVRKFISGLRVIPTIEEPISMYCDNTGA
nr:hypothetical protein [Tanacetum cinerariifolium]